VASIAGGFKGCGALYATPEDGLVGALLGDVLDEAQDIEVGGLMLEPSLDVAAFRMEHNIVLKGTGDEEYLPFYQYSDTPFSPAISQVFTRLGYTVPTPIQAQSWPIALAGRDIISVARTGSGKTCGFLMPAFHKLMLEARQPKVGIIKPVEEKVEPTRGKIVQGEGGRRSYQASSRMSGGRGGRKSRPPRVLVLAPTRELVCQIEEEAQKYTHASGIWSTSLYGGTPKQGQIRTLRSGVDVIIATPGRCNDLADMGVLDLSEIQYLVLDEADRMLDMGFEPQIRQIIEQTPDDRQSLFFSATWPKDVRSLASEFLNGPVQVNIGSQGGQLVANKAISQHIKIVREREKEDELFDLLQYMNPSDDKAPAQIPKSIIFVGRKSACDELAYSMRDEGYRVDTLHGDKSQYMRTKAIDNFKKGRLNVLIATDVAARGLDVKDIEAVINYDFPIGGNGVEDYVHRIGRTARGSNEGTAYTFFTQGDRQRAAELVGVLERAGQDVPADLLAFVPRGGHGGGGRGGGRGRGGRGGGGRGGGGGSRGYRGGGGSGGGSNGWRDSYGGGGGGRYSRRDSGGGGSYDRRDGGSYSESYGGDRQRSFQGGGSGYRGSSSDRGGGGTREFSPRALRAYKPSSSGSTGTGSGGGGGGGVARKSSFFEHFEKAKSTQPDAGFSSWDDGF
jgi:ATP-dependent RNA helicase DDX5/DBP2